MKKSVYLIFVLILTSLVFSTGVNASNVEETTLMYTLDGKTAYVPNSQVTSHLALGWLLEPMTLMYNSSGNTAYVPNSQIEAHISLGWFLEAVTPMYNTEGYMIHIPNSQLEAHHKLGWYYEPVAVMYAPDGRSAVVTKREVESYKKSGWYIPVVMMYSPDGTIEVPQNEVGKYKGYGWSDCPVIRMYSQSGEETIAPCYLKEEYKKQGWLESYEYFMGKSYAWLESKYGELEYYGSAEGGEIYEIPNINMFVVFACNYFDYYYDYAVVRGDKNKVYTGKVVIPSMYSLFPELVAQSHNGYVSINSLNSYFGQKQYIEGPSLVDDLYWVGYTKYNPIDKKWYEIWFYNDNGSQYINIHSWIEVCPIEY